MFLFCCWSKTKGDFTQVIVESWFRYDGTMDPSTQGYHNPRQFTFEHREWWTLQCCKWCIEVCWTTVAIDVMRGSVRWARKVRLPHRDDQCTRRTMAQQAHWGYRHCTRTSRTNSIQPILLFPCSRCGTTIAALKAMLEPIILCGSCI